ncbi:MAG: hypothetical protein ACM65M_24010 [Microcoleus sp.]
MQSLGRDRRADGREWLDRPVPLLHGEGLLLSAFFDDPCFGSAELNDRYIARS